MKNEHYRSDSDDESSNNKKPAEFHYDAPPKPAVERVPLPPGLLWERPHPTPKPPLDLLLGKESHPGRPAAHESLAQESNEDDEDEDDRKTATHKLPPKYRVTPPPVAPRYYHPEKAHTDPDTTEAKTSKASVEDADEATYATQSEHEVGVEMPRTAASSEQLYTHTEPVSEHTFVPLNRRVERTSEEPIETPVSYAEIPHAAFASSQGEVPMPRPADHETYVPHAEAHDVTSAAATEPLPGFAAHETSATYPAQEAGFASQPLAPETIPQAASGNGNFIPPIPPIEGGTPPAAHEGDQPDPVQAYSRMHHTGSPGMGFTPEQIMSTPVVPVAEHAPVIIQRKADWPARLLAAGSLVSGWRTRRKLKAQIKANEQASQKRFTQLEDQQALMQRQARQAEIRQRFNAAPAGQLGSEHMAHKTGEQRLANRGPERPGTMPQANVDPRLLAQQLAEQQAQQAEEANSQPEGREVQDAWRRYKVDSHNREIVDNTTVHGQAMRQEQRAETQAFATNNSQSPSAQTHSVGTASQAPMGGVVGLATGAGLGAEYGQGQAQTQQQSQYSSALPSGITNPVLPQGAPTHVDPQHQLPPAPASTHRTTSNAPGVWFWVMLGIIVAAFFAAALI